MAILKDTIIQGSTNTLGGLKVGKNASINGDCSVVGNSTVGGTCNITGNTTVGGTCSITGDTTVGGTCSITGNTLISGNTTLGASGSSRTTTINGPCVVNGGIRLGSGEYVTFTEDYGNHLKIYADDGMSLVATDSSITFSSYQRVASYNNGDLSLPGAVYASGGFYQSSDINKKDIIDDLDLNKAYELVDKCQTILYTFKDSPDKQEIGLIAQEVQQFFPEIVTTDKDGFLNLDYTKLSVIIIKVLKDVIDRINNLELKINKNNNE